MEEYDPAGCEWLGSESAYVGARATPRVEHGAAPTSAVEPDVVPGGSTDLTPAVPLADGTDTFWSSDGDGPGPSDQDQLWFAGRDEQFWPTWPVEESSRWRQKAVSWFVLADTAVALPLSVALGGFHSAGNFALTWPLTSAVIGVTFLTLHQAAKRLTGWVRL